MSGVCSYCGDGVCTCGYVDMGAIPVTLTIKISLDNAAFEDSPEHEIALAFKTIASKLPFPLEPCKIRVMDSNGNSVGFATITE